MTLRTYHLVADIASTDSETIHPVLRRLRDSEITPTQDGFLVVATCKTGGVSKHLLDCAPHQLHR